MRTVRKDLQREFILYFRGNFETFMRFVLTMLLSLSLQEFCKQKVSHRAVFSVLILLRVHHFRMASFIQVL